MKRLGISLLAAIIFIFGISIPVNAIGIPQNQQMPGYHENNYRPQKPTKPKEPQVNPKIKEPQAPEEEKETIPEKIEEEIIPEKIEEETTPKEENPIEEEKEEVPTEEEVPEIEPTTETITASGIYVLKQGVSSDLDITKSSSNQYWTSISYPVDNVTITLGEGNILVVNISDYTNASVSVSDEAAFLSALNQAVTGSADDDCYIWSYQKVISENNGYHLDCIAYVPTYEITFVTNADDITIDNQSILRNDIASTPSIERENFTLDGWYTDSEFTSPYDFSIPVKSNITLYAKWTEIPTEEEEKIVIPIPTPAPEVELSDLEVEDTPTEDKKEEVKPTLDDTSISTIIIEETSVVNPNLTQNEIINITPTVSFETSTEPIVPTVKEESITTEDIIGGVSSLEITNIEDNEVPLADNIPDTSKEGSCIIHIIMYILILIYGLFFAIIAFSKKKKNRKFYFTRILSYLLVVALCVLLFFSGCELDIFVMILGAVIAAGGFIAAKHFKNLNENEETE